MTTQRTAHDWDDDDWWIFIELMRSATEGRLLLGTFKTGDGEQVEIDELEALKAYMEEFSAIDRDESAALVMQKLDTIQMDPESLSTLFGEMAKFAAAMTIKSWNADPPTK
jgi:hypothetical protein